MHRTGDGITTPVPEVLWMETQVIIMEIAAVARGPTAGRLPPAPAHLDPMGPT